MTTESPDELDDATPTPLGDSSGSVEQVSDSPGDSDTIDTEDGGAIVKLDDVGASSEQVEDFYRNLVDLLPANVRATLANELHTAVDEDKEARKLREKQYEEGIRRTGLGNDAPGGASFQGASRAVHPVLTKGCIDFEARAIAELMPSNGVVRDYIPGTVTPARADKARRKSAHMNWQLKTQMPEFRPELEQLLSQIPLGGSQFLYIVWSERRRRPMATYWPSDDVIIPYGASNVMCAERLTQVERISQREYDRRVADGYYSEPVTPAPAAIPDETKPEKASNRVEGQENTGTNIDGLRPMWRVYTELELDEDPETQGEPAPYIIEMDPSDQEVKRLVRNWEMDDKQRTAMQWLIEFPFLPWRGALSIGLAHVIGSLAGAATGALRALLDSAHINNFPGMVKLKGSNFSGQSKQTDVGTVVEMDGGVGLGQDIRSLIMPMPYNPTSNVLLQLLGVLTEEAESTVMTSLRNLTEMNVNNMAVGTSLAVTEQGMKVLGGIHLRLFDAMTRVLATLHRINRLYLTDEEINSETGELLARRSDYEGPLDVIPVADPNVFSDAQRMMQLQMISERAAAMPQLYDLRKVEEALLERTKFPAAKGLLLPKNDPKPMNAVNENASLALGRPVQAFPDQDHLAHLQVHLDFLTSPVLGKLSIIAPRFIGPCLDHIAQHITLWYVKAFYDTGTQQLGVDFAQTMGTKDPKVNEEIDKFLAQLSPEITGDASKVLGALPAIVQQAQQLMAALAPPPQDPQLAAAQLAAKASSEKTASGEKVAQLKVVAQKQVADVAAQAALDKQHAADSARMAMNTEDNQTALTIAEAEMLNGGKTNMKDGSGINPGS